MSSKGPLAERPESIEIGTASTLALWTATLHLGGWTAATRTATTRSTAARGGEFDLTG